jgi:DNA invertase Pin-like site-specific DNA recombinase
MVRVPCPSTCRSPRSWTWPHRNGDADAEIVVEWGVSGASAKGAFGGTGRGGRRKSWRRLRERIDAGEVSVLYAYSLSRLARSSQELLALAESCAANGVVIRLAKEGTLDWSSPHGRLYLTVLAAAATFETEVASERGRDRTQAARDQGKYIGRPPFGYTFDEDGSLTNDPDTYPVVEDVVAAMNRVGTYRGDAKDLKARKVPARQGGRWTGESVARSCSVSTVSPCPDLASRAVARWRRGPSAVCSIARRVAGC